MYGLGRYVTAWGDITLEGRVVYSDHVVDIPAYAISPEFIEQLGSLIRRVADKKPALVVPSSTECGFCPITLEDCPQRISAPPEAVAVEGFEGQLCDQEPIHWHSLPAKSQLSRNSMGTK